MRFTNLSRATALSISMALAGAASAASYVYVSNADDSNISTYTLQSDGVLQPGARVEAAKLVMPMSVSPDRHYLYASIRSKPFTVITYAIDPKTGDLKQLSTAPLAESYPYITVDKTGRFLLGASYGANQVGVNAIGKGGKVSDPKQVIPTGAQRPLDHHRQHQPLRLRAAPGHRPDLPVPLRREDGPPDFEYACRGPDESDDRPAAYHRVG